jgi:hypothetical protein
MSLKKYEIIQFGDTCPHCNKQIEIFIDKKTIKELHKAFKEQRMPDQKATTILILKKGDYDRIEESMEKR